VYEMWYINKLVLL